MTTLGPCPNCGCELAGLGTKCWECGTVVHEFRAHEQPAAAIPDTRSEKEIERGIMHALRMLGFHVVKLSQPQRVLASAGTSDLLVMGAGVILFAEVKRPGGKGRRGGKQSSEQREFESHVRANGGAYVVWTSEDEAIRWASGVLQRTVSGERTG